MVYELYLGKAVFLKVHNVLLHSFKKFFLIIFFLAVLGFRCCTWAFSSCGEWGLLFVVVHGLLIVVASLVIEHGL